MTEAEFAAYIDQRLRVRAALVAALGLLHPDELDALDAALPAAPKKGGRRAPTKAEQAAGGILRLAWVGLPGGTP